MTFSPITLDEDLEPTDSEMGRSEMHGLWKQIEPVSQRVLRLNAMVSLGKFIYNFHRVFTRLPFYHLVFTRVLLSTRKTDSKFIPKTFDLRFQQQGIPRSCKSHPPYSLHALSFNKFFNVLISKSWLKNTFRSFKLLILTLTNKNVLFRNTSHHLCTYYTVKWPTC